MELCENRGYFIDVEGILFEVGKGSINRARGGAMCKCMGFIRLVIILWRMYMFMCGPAICLFCCLHSYKERIISARVHVF